MKLGKKQLEEAIFGRIGFQRFTQDSPVLPEVWLKYGDEPTMERDLLLTPTWGTPPGKLSNALAARLQAERKKASWKKVPRHKKPRGPGIAYNISTVAVGLYFDELIRVVLPMTPWWNKYILANKGKVFNEVISSQTFRDKLSKSLTASVKDSDDDSDDDELKVWDLNRALKHKVWGQNPPQIHPNLIWLIKLVGGIIASIHDEKPSGRTIINEFARLMKNLIRVPKKDAGGVWAANLNRQAKAMVWHSTTAVKADAARRLFEVSCKDIYWAVVDSGIDATHPAFRAKLPDGSIATEAFKNGKGATENLTRIVKTYDFTAIREILSREQTKSEDLTEAQKKRFKGVKKRFAKNAKQKKELKNRLLKGRALDWEILAPLLEIPHTKKDYEPPVFEHGTHVACILAANWDKDELSNHRKMEIQGVCPDLSLYDMRVLDENGESDEFSILAALQFVLYLIANSDNPLLQGVNISLSIRHKVKNFACGCTPVCEEVERLVNSGLIVVAAAGNDGYLELESAGAVVSESYRSISITDPGNAQGVITVGSTHRDSPHTYGVSYFSSRGPTGDGRMKPDLVAPGEKITSTVPENGLKSMDGTSMAAPHVSGAAALLIARHRELIGKPGRVKQILCDTATDLGRERYFQGSGMVDILRAMQSV
jgi:subtilisin family serine protease